MSIFRHSTGDDITLQLGLRDPSTGLGVRAADGGAPTVQIRRIRASQGGAVSDFFYWNGTIFTSTPTQIAMAEFDAVNDRGLWTYFFDQTLAGTNTIYEVRFEQVGGVAAGFTYEQHIVTNEIFIPVSAPVVAIPAGATVMGELFDFQDANGPANQAAADALLDETLAPHAAIPGSVAEAIAACGALGTGANQVTLTVEDNLTAPVAGAQVDIFDSTNTFFLGRVFTDIAGQVVIALNDDSYNARIFSSGLSFTVPEPFVVSGATSVTFTALDATFTLPPPTLPNLCVIFGTNMTDAGGNDLVGACVQAFASTPQSVAGRQLGEPIAETTTDQNGNFTLELIRLAEVRFTIEDAGLDFIKTVPDLASQDVTTWP